MAKNDPAPEPEPEPEPPKPDDDTEAAAVWARLAPHAKKSFGEVLDDYFADPGEPGGTGDDGHGSGGTGAASTAGGGDGAGGAGKAGKGPAKAQGQGPDIGQQLSDFFFGKRPASK